MFFSKRTDWNFQVNELTRLCEEKKKNKEEIFDLTLSNPTACGFDYLKTGLVEALSDPENVSYAPDARGLLSAREAVSNYYAKKNTQVSPDQIFLTSSTSEAYAFLFRLIADAKDSVSVPAPSYPLFHFLTDLSDIEPSPYRLSYEGRWLTRKRSLEESLKANTRAVLVVNPNNPTGNLTTPIERDFLNQAACDKEFAIISDEVFLDFVRDESKTAAESFASNEEALTFTLSGVSKILGLPQMKLSWIVVNGPDEVKREAIKRLEVIADTYLSVNTPAQHALPAWFKSAPRIQAEILSRVRQNRDTLEKIFKGRVLNADAGWYSVLKMDLGSEEEAYCLKLLREKNVLVHPGYFFDFEEENILVVSLLPPVHKFEKAVRYLL